MPAFKSRYYVLYGTATLSIMTFNIMTLGILKLIIMDLTVTLITNDTEKNVILGLTFVTNLFSVIMVILIMLNVAVS